MYLARRRNYLIPVDAELNGTMLKVLVVNDLATPMEFVVWAQQVFFGQTEPEAEQTTPDHAITAATESARRHGHPLSFVTRRLSN
jgi:hypothetical protein